MVTTQPFVTSASRSVIDNEIIMPAGGRFIALGDSLIGNGALPNSAGGSTLYTSSYHQRGYINWLQAMYNYPFFHEFFYTGSIPFQGCNKGVSGDETYQVLGRIDGQAISQKGDTVFITLGTNDIKSGRTTANTCSNLRLIIDTILSTGARVVITTIFPRNNDFGNGFTAGQEAIRIQVNSWISTLDNTAEGGVCVIDSDSVLGGTTLNASYTYDGIHLNSLGAQTMAQAVYAKMAYTITVSPRYVPESYNTPSLIYGNIMNNADFGTATGGTVGTGASGTCPSSWSISRSSGSVATVAGSTVVNTNWNGVSSNFYQMDITSVGSGADTDIIRFGISTAVTSNIAVGDMVVVEVEVLMSDITSGSNILRSFYVEGRDNGTNGECVRFFATRFTNVSYKDYFPSGVQRLILRSHPFRLVTTTGALFRVEANIDTTVTGTRTVSITQPVMRKVAFKLDEPVTKYKQSFYAVTAAGNTIIPMGAAIRDIIIVNTTANAITGGLKIGTTSGGTDVVAAQAVGANAVIAISDSALLKRFFSLTANQALFFDAVSAWNNASLTIIITYNILN